MYLASPSPSLRGGCLRGWFLGLISDSKTHLGSVVLGGSDKHGHVPGSLDVIDLLRVLLGVHEDLP